MAGLSIIIVFLSKFAIPIVALGAVISVVSGFMGVRKYADTALKSHGDNLITRVALRILPYAVLVLASCVGIYASLYVIRSDGAVDNIGFEWKEDGRGDLPKDDREAARLYKLGADRGNVDSAFRLGAFFEEGRGGLPKDDREAARLYKLAADKGNDNAIFRLGMFFEEGRGGLPKDDREAARLYRLAVDQGNVDAIFRLGTFFQEGWGGLPQDYREAARLYQLAADKGNADALGVLGYLYETGLGAVKDLRKAAQFYRLAADGGDSFAMARLSTFYAYGLGGVPTDKKEADRLLASAIRQSQVQPSDVIKETIPKRKQTK